MTRRAFPGAASAALPDDRRWLLFLEKRFTTPDFQKRWPQAGEGDFDLCSEGGRGFPHIQTRRPAASKRLHHSVLWYRERLDGHLRFEFRAPARQNKGATFYMNARTPPGSTYRTVFDWKRPGALEERYSALPDFEACTFGSPRAPELNLRRMDGFPRLPGHPGGH